MQQHMIIILYLNALDIANHARTVGVEIERERDIEKHFDQNNHNNHNHMRFVFVRTMQQLCVYLCIIVQTVGAKIQHKITCFTNLFVELGLHT